MEQHGPVQDFPVKGRIVAITGGGSEIGLVFARLCHDNGARILIGDLKLTQEAEDFIKQSGDHKAVTFQECDVTSWQSLHHLVTVSVDIFGEVPDVYVPCAGVFEPPWSNFWADTEDQSYRMIRINVDHPIKLTRLAMRALASARKQGVFILVASTAGIRGSYVASLYASTKHAVVGFAKSMGQADPEEGVKIVAILPGMVHSPWWTSRNDELAKECKYEDREGLHPADIATVMLKMVERTEYEGGTCVLKTPTEERIVEEGYMTGERKQMQYDPSPRPLGHRSVEADHGGREGAAVEVMVLLRIPTSW